MGFFYALSEPLTGPVPIEVCRLAVIVTTEVTAQTSGFSMLCIAGYLASICLDGDTDSSGQLGAGRKVLHVLPSKAA